jgi:hypothetical protein
VRRAWPLRDRGKEWPGPSEAGRVANLILLGEEAFVKYTTLQRGLKMDNETLYLLDGSGELGWKVTG